MSGAPIEALKIGAKLIGDKYYDAEDRPFEEFYTFNYNNYCEVSMHNEKSAYESEI